MKLSESLYFASIMQSTSDSSIIARMQAYSYALVKLRFRIILKSFFNVSDVLVNFIHTKGAYSVLALLTCPVSVLLFRGRRVSVIVLCCHLCAPSTPSFYFLWWHRHFCS